MPRLSKAIEAMFSGEMGSTIYERTVDTIEKESMLPMMEKGILVGFSGGGDSVMLIAFLHEYQRRTKKSLNLLAVHVNHCIRGEESDRDEEFARAFLKELCIPFESVRIDVVALSEKLGTGIEETARNARYSAFDDIIKSRNDISTIAVAHNSADNAETVIMNMLRGSGLSGVCGIKPVRDNIIRPLIAIPKTVITGELDKYEIPYVTDSTNLSVNYSRNYVRHVIFPTLKQLSNDPVESFSRLTENLRSDLDYLNSQAERFLTDVGYENIRASSIRELHPAIQARVFSILVHKNTGIYVEEKHITALKELIKSNNFHYSLPGEKMFACERGLCIFLPKKNTNNVLTQIFSLSFGENKISGTNLTVFIGDVDKTSLNVYNFSIQASISSAIIDSGLILRFKYDGDSYRYSGKTHKLKKVFNDRNIPPSQRSRIPIICDSEGIVLLPGMSVRDGAISDVSSDNIPITFAYGTPSDTEAELFTALLRR